MIKGIATLQPHLPNGELLGEGGLDRRGSGAGAALTAHLRHLLLCDVGTQQLLKAHLLPWQGWQGQGEGLKATPLGRVLGRKTLINLSLLLQVNSSYQSFK